MEESILATIKSMLGVSDLDDAFNNDILVNINAAFSTLYQVGVGEDSHYFVLKGDETWSDIFKETDLIDFIKLYTYMKVRLAFDPPSNASLLQSLKDQINEIEYRIMLQADPADYFNPVDENGKALTDNEIKKIWEEIMGSIPSVTPTDGEPLTDQEIRDLWKEIMGEISSSVPGGVLTDGDLRAIWKEIMGSIPETHPGIAISDDELMDIWKEIMGSVPSIDSKDVLSNEDITKMFNEIMH